MRNRNTEYSAIKSEVERHRQTAMRILYLMLALATAASCSPDYGGRDASEESAGASDIAEMPAAPLDLASSAVARQRPEAEPVPGSMIIRTGEADVEVRALQPAINAVRRLIDGMGGHIVDMSLQVGRAQRREARLVARVPATTFDSAIAALRPLGEVQHVGVSARDVGEEYVDVQAQLRNRKALESRFLELLANRTGELEDVLAVERELARVRQEIERAEGRLRYLENQVALSTLTVMLREPAPIISTFEGQNVFAHAVQTAWRNFIGLIVALIASLGIVLPLAAVIIAIWYVRKYVRRRRAAAR